MSKRAYLDNGVDGQIHYVVAGNGPAVLLLHQTPRSIDEFAEVIGLLKDKVCLIAMDLPGMGASSPIGRHPTIESYADAAIRVIEASTDEPLVVCGHHTGGVVAMEIAGRRPDLIQSLVLSSTPWVDANARKARAAKTPIDYVKRSGDGCHLIDLWRQRCEFYPDKTEYLDRFIADALRARRPEEGHEAVGCYQMENIVGDIRCPVLIVDHMNDPFATKHVQHLQRAIPQASVEHVPDGRIPLEATAAEFAEILQAWMLGASANAPSSNLRVAQ